MSEQVVPSRLARCPQSAPAWVWIGYLLLMAVCSWLGIRGGLEGLFGVAAAMTFSFQFWTFVTWRGLLRREGNLTTHRTTEGERE